MNKLIEVLFSGLTIYILCVIFISCDVKQSQQPTSYATVKLNVLYFQSYKPIIKTTRLFSEVNRAEIVFYHIDQSLDQTIEKYYSSEREFFDSTRTDLWNFNSYWLEYDHELLSEVTQNSFEIVKRDTLLVANERVSGDFSLSPGLKSLRLACLHGDTVVYTGTYFWRVRCRDALLRWSEWSEVWSFTISS